MLTFESKPARILCRALCVILANGCIPLGFAVLVKDPFAKPAPAPLDTRTHAKPSRVMSSKEQKTQQGRIGECPYLAGQNKWDPTYKGVDMLTGNYSLSVTDLSFEGGYGIPVNITRSYSANMYDEGAFGQGWTMSADVRSTAGGLLKGPAAPVQSIPTAFKERPPTESNPVAELADGAAAQPAQAVIATDSGGTAETVQRDVDGVLTTPPWDNNTNNPTYELVSFGGSIYQCLTGNQVTTLDGTVYTYAKKGNYPSGNTPYNNPSATATPANVLKVTTAVDRQGNTTTYGYGSGTISLVKDDGTTSEHPLTTVTMPNGHVITLTWGNGSSTPANRVVSVSDGCGRTVTYGYTHTSGAAGYTGGSGLSGGQLTSVTTPGGKTTSYSYGGAYQPSGWSAYGLDAAYSLLTGITDPRGMTTAISYQMDIKTVEPYDVQVSGPVVTRIAAPNGINADFVFDNQFPSTGPIYDLIVPTGYSTATVGGFYEYPASQISGTNVCFNTEEFIAIPNIVTNELSVLFQVNNLAIVDGTTYGLQTRKDYSIQTEDLMTDREVNQGFAWGNGPCPNLDTARALPEASWTYQMVTTADTYNFGGNKLSETVTEKEMDSGTLNTIRTAETDYAYWDATKYYQQKAVKDQAGRYSMTDYYANSAGAGSRGQTYKVYDNAHAGFYLDTSITPPSWASSSDYWKYQLTPTSGDYSADFNYDSKGRATDVYKLQNSSGTYSYVQTHTTYGSDTDGSWGEASAVVEDYGGIGRTTSTNAYTSDGKADDVTDAAGHEFVTSYDGDGVVQSVTRTDSGSTTLVSYTYGTSGITNGMPTAITDGLSGVSQSISYDTTSTDPGYGQVASVTETNGSDSYTDSYTYGATGDRATATYATPAATMRWQYGDYVPVGDPSKATRNFQTLTLLDSSSNPTSEELHYSYDQQGRLQDAAFAQSPASGYTPSSGGDWYGTYSSPHLASVRARAFYTYDPGGRILSLYHWWDTYGSGSYSSTAILGNSCAYEYTGSKRGLKTASTYWTNSSGSFADAWDETYGYDSNFGYLTSFVTTDGHSNASQSWSYDAAGNRISDYTGTSWAYDHLNRMTANGAGTSSTNDILGNRTALGSATSYSWDCLNRMTGYNGGTAYSYSYRVDGMRVTKTTGSNTDHFRYDGQMPIEDACSIGTAEAVENGLGARGIDYNSVTTGSGTSVYFPVYDAHGNQVATLSRSGSSYSVSNQREFDPWGNIRGGSSTGDPTSRYCASLGHKQDDESLLVYMRARYYEPSSGRFTSEDPNRSGLNWFGYANLNPILNADRSGKDSGMQIVMFFVCILLIISGVLMMNCARGMSLDVDAIKDAYGELGEIIAHYSEYTEGTIFQEGGSGTMPTLEQLETMEAEASSAIDDIEGLASSTKGAGMTACGVGCAGITALLGYNAILQGMIFGLTMDVNGPDPFAALFGG